METTSALMVRGCDTGVALCSVTWLGHWVSWVKLEGENILKRSLPITRFGCPAKRVCSLQNQVPFDPQAWVLHIPLVIPFSRGTPALCGCGIASDVC